MTTQEMYRKRILQGATVETEYADTMFDADFRSRFPFLSTATVEELEAIHQQHEQHRFDQAAQRVRALMDDKDFHLYRVLVETTA